MKKTDFFDREDRCYFVPNPDQMTVYCKQYWPEEVKHILRIAEEVCENYFLFDLPWDMERTYEPVIFKEDIDWNYTPNGDPEFVWQFNRHRYFICLGQAYQITKDEKYAHGFLRLITDWMDRVPLTSENKEGPWRMLETGLRGETWTKAIRYFKDSDVLTDEFWEQFTSCLQKHAERLVEEGRDARLPSNWCVLENSGLFEIAISLPQSPDTKKWIEIALRQLKNAVSVQVYPDGYQWEQSPMYHNEVYHCLCCVIYLARANHIVLDDVFVNTVHQMARCNLIWKKPNHMQLTQGDSDETDLRDKLAMGAYLFQDGMLKFAAYPHLDFEGAWDFGTKGCTDYEHLKTQIPDFTSYAMEESGNYYLRSSFSEEANVLHFFSGRLSTGHCHGDKLHIDLIINGEDVLIDAGRATYENIPIRFLLKENAGHNTTMVDGKPFNTFSDSWYTKKLAYSINNKFHCTKSADFVQGAHLGYLSEGVIVNRKIVWIKPDIYVLIDEFLTDGMHEYSQIFHFATDGTIDVSAREVQFQGKKTEAYFQFLTENIKLVESKGMTSTHYNQSTENQVVTAKLKQEGVATIITVINGGEKGKTEKANASFVPVCHYAKGQQYTDKEAHAIKITTQNEAYLLMTAHDEIYHGTDGMIAENCFGTAQVCLFDLNQRKEGERLYGGEVLFS